MSERDGFISPDGLASYLTELHEQLCPGMAGGEITFREVHSEDAAPNNTAWARATYADGQLQQVYYVRPTQSIGGVQHVHSLLFQPLESSETQWEERTDHLCIDGSLNTKSIAATNQQTTECAANEVHAFILDAMSTDRYQRSPEIAPVFYGDTYPVRSWRLHQMSEKLRRAGEIGLGFMGCSSEYTLQYMHQSPEVDTD